MLSKNQIKELARREGFYLKKKIGQNILIDRNMISKIVESINIESRDIVLEIGAGLGALTEGLAAKAKKVYAVENDKKIYQLACQILAHSANIKMIHSDILEFDLKSLNHDLIKVVGAIPYSITAPIIEYLIVNRKRISGAHLLVQKEVAHRLRARVGDDNYCSLSIFVELYAEVRESFDISRTVFFPEPKVDSTLIEIRFRKAPAVECKDEGLLIRVMRQAFSQRRKMILSSLSHKGLLGITKPEFTEILEGINIDPKSRPEDLPLASFAQISDALIDFLL